MKKRESMEIFQKTNPSLCLYLLCVYLEGRQVYQKLNIHTLNSSCIKQLKYFLYDMTIKVCRDHMPLDYTRHYTKWPRTSAAISSVTSQFVINWLAEFLVSFTQKFRAKRTLNSFLITKAYSFLFTETVIPDERTINWLYKDLPAQRSKCRSGYASFDKAKNQFHLQHKTRSLNLKSNPSCYE